MADDDSSSDDEPRMEEVEFIPNNPVAEFTVTGGISGTFTAELFLDRMPLTVSNFIDLANRGFYNGLHIHRVIPDFMFQFGCPHSADSTSVKAGSGGPPDGTFTNLKTGANEERSGGGFIKDEFISRDSNLQGALAMANVGKQDTGGSQFFVNVKDNPHLDWFSEGESQHPVFGRIIDGFGICMSISRVRTASKGALSERTADADNPMDAIKMLSVTVSGFTAT